MHFATVSEFIMSLGVANGLLKILGLGKFSSDLEISEALICAESRNLVFACMYFLRLGLGFLCSSPRARIFKLLASRRVSDFHTIRYVVHIL